MSEAMHATGIPDLTARERIARTRERERRARPRLRGAARAAIPLGVVIGTLVRLLLGHPLVRVLADRGWWATALLFACGVALQAFGVQRLGRARRAPSARLDPTAFLLVVACLAFGLVLAMAAFDAWFGGGA